MKKLKIFIVVVCILIFGSALFAGDEKATTQISTIDALLNGDYEGDISLGDLKKYGDFGIGTVNFLDGELLLLNGKYYRVKADGSVDSPSENTITPFASVAFFKPQTSVKLKEDIDFYAFKKDADKILPTVNIFYAVKLEGSFKIVKTRSVPKQSKPYKPLIEVVKNQPVFKFENVKGVMVGFRCPPYAKGINVPGYHLHFLTDDKKGGGHVLDFKTDDVELKICRILNFRMLLPNNEAFFKTNLSIDRDKELKKVESDKK